MFAKVAYLCAIMAAVQSRSVLYGTSIFELILPSNHDLSSMNNKYKTENCSEVDEWKYTVYDIASKFLQSLRRKIKFRNYMTDSSGFSEKADSNISTTKFDEVTNDTGLVGINNEFSKDDFQNGSSIQFVIPVTENITSSFSVVTKSHIAKEIMQQQMPSLVAFEYHN